MSISSHKCLTMAFGVACVCLLVVSGALFWIHGWLRTQVAFADEQTRVFDEMRTQALQSDAAGAASCLEYVVSYYPSGSKQETGSRLDRIVERERSLAAGVIIAHLRVRTGQDLGESPEAWVREYAKP